MGIDFGTTNSVVTALSPAALFGGNAHRNPAAHFISIADGQRLLLGRSARHVGIFIGGELVQALGLSNISKSIVPKLWKRTIERVMAFADRPLEDKWPYLWLDVIHLHQREGGRFVSVAAMIAVASTSPLPRPSLSVQPSQEPGQAEPEGREAAQFQ